MRRLALLPIALILIACPGDKKGPDTVAVQPAVTDTAADTTPGDLSGVSTTLPPPAPDTFTPAPPRRNPPASNAGAIPNAPPALMEVVQREQEVSRFCFQEYGQKSDPRLRGNVAMLVTVGQSGISDTRVADSNWSSSAGRSVNTCLSEKTKAAWRLTPGSVRPGRYVVQLSFSAS